MQTTIVSKLLGHAQPRVQLAKPQSRRLTVGAMPNSESEVQGLRPEGLKFIEDSRQRILSGEYEEQNRPDPVESPSQSDSSFMSPAGTQPRSWVEVDEEDPARFPFHKSLALAAKTANGEMAEVAVASMVRAGLVPGPKAWHAVVFSHVRDSRAQGESGLKFAISAASRAFRAGIRLDSQTYLVLIAAHLKYNMLREACQLYAHMERHEISTNDAWPLVARSLFLNDNHEALDFYRKGAAKGLVPSADLLESALRALLTTPDGLAEANTEMERYKLKGRKLEARHVNLLLRAQCRQSGMAQQAETLLENMKNGMYGLPRPDAATLEMMAEGMAMSSMGGEGRRRGAESVEDEETMMEKLDLIRGLIAEYGLRPSPRYYALMVGNYLNAESVDEAFESYLKMRATGTGGSIPQSMLSDKTLTTLVQRLSEAGRPYDMLRVLMAMARDGRRPIVTEWPGQNPRDQSHLTLWIGRVPQSEGGGRTEGRAVKGGIQAALDEMERKQQETENEEIVKLEEDVFIRGTTCVDQDGRVVSLSKMTAKMMKIELKLKGVDDTGMKRKDMQKRLQALRREDTGLLEVAKRLKKEREKEEKKQRLFRILTPEQRMEEEMKKRVAELSTEAKERGISVEELMKEMSTTEEEDDDTRRRRNRKFLFSFSDGSGQKVDSNSGRNDSTAGTSRAVATPAEVAMRMESRRRLQRSLMGDEDFRKAITGEAMDEDDTTSATSMFVPGQDDDVLEEKSRASRGDDREVRLSEDDDESIRIDERYGDGIGWLNIGNHMSNTEGGIDHAYNILSASAKLGVRPRLGDWLALLDTIEVVKPAYPRAAFYLMRLLDQLCIENMYTREDVTPLVQRAAEIVLASGDLAITADVYAYVMRASQDLPEQLMDSIKTQYINAVREGLAKPMERDAMEGNAAVFRAITEGAEQGDDEVGSIRSDARLKGNAGRSLRISGEGDELPDDMEVEGTNGAEPRGADVDDLV